MALPDPPVHSPPVVLRDPEGRGLPETLMSWDWQQYFFGIAGEVQKAPTLASSAVVLALQQASLAATGFPLSTVPPGLYRISYYTRITQAATTSSSLTVQFAWTDGAVSMSSSGAAITGNTVTTFQSGVVNIRSDDGTPITYETTYASAGATSMQYRLTMAIEALALEAAS